MRSTEGTRIDELSLHSENRNSDTQRHVNYNRLLESKDMTRIEQSDGRFLVDAELLCEVFHMDEKDVQVGMRAGTIVSRCEEGSGEDSGRWRLTFTHGNRACRLVVDSAGTILKRATYPVRAR